jgi:hypothetical protein
MTQRMSVLVIWGVLIGGTLSAADDDPVGAKLATAKEESAKDSEKARRLLSRSAEVLSQGVSQPEVVGVDASGLQRPPG